MVFIVKRFVPALIWNTRGCKWSLGGADEVMLKLSAKVCPDKKVHSRHQPTGPHPTPCPILLLSSILQDLFYKMLWENRA